MSSNRWSHNVSYERGNSNFAYVSPPRVFNEKKYRRPPQYERAYEERMERESKYRNKKNVMDFDSTVPYYLRRNNRIKLHNEHRKGRAFHCGPAPLSLQERLKQRRSYQEKKKGEEGGLPKIESYSDIRARREDFHYRQEIMSAKKQQQLRKHKEKRQTLKNGGAPRSPARKRQSDELSDLGELSGYDEKYNGEGYEGGYSQGTVEATGQVGRSRSKKKPGFSTELAKNTPAVMEVE